MSSVVLLRTVRVVWSSTSRPRISTTSPSAVRSSVMSGSPKTVSRFPAPVVLSSASAIARSGSTMRTSPRVPAGTPGGRPAISDSLRPAGRPPQPRRSAPSAALDAAHEVTATSPSGPVLVTTGTVVGWQGGRTTTGGVTPPPPPAGTPQRPAAPLADLPSLEAQGAALKSKRTVTAALLLCRA